MNQQEYQRLVRRTAAELADSGVDLYDLIDVGVPTNVTDAIDLLRNASDDAPYNTYDLNNEPGDWEMAVIRMAVSAFEHDVRLWLEELTHPNVCSEHMNHEVTMLAEEVAGEAVYDKGRWWIYATLGDTELTYRVVNTVSGLNYIKEEE